MENSIYAISDYITTIILYITNLINYQQLIESNYNTEGEQTILNEKNFSWITSNYNVIWSELGVQLERVPGLVSIELPPNSKHLSQYTKYEIINANNHQVQRIPGTDGDMYSVNIGYESSLVIAKLYNDNNDSTDISEVSEKEAVYFMRDIIRSLYYALFYMNGLGR